MAYFASEMQKDWRASMPGLMFGRHSLHNNLEHDRYGLTNVGRNYWSVLEAGINATLANIVHGSPMIRCSFAGGGADSFTYNTYVTGGAGAGTSTAGCFLNFAGISAFNTQDDYAGASPNLRNLIIAFHDITTVPAAGSTLTQAVTGATGIVIATSNVYNYVIVRDLNTGTWNLVNNVTDGGGAMVPAVLIPRGLIYGSSISSNADSFQAGAGIWVIVRGYTPAWCQGDVAGTGYNGDITDCTPLTWNYNIAALVAAAYHDTADAAGDSGDTLDVYVNPDNVIAHAMQGGATALDNSGHTPELILVYVRADEPLVYAESTKQGIDPSIVRQ